jgi:hypothetical protein
MISPICSCRATEDTAKAIQKGSATEALGGFQKMESLMQSQYVEEALEELNKLIKGDIFDLDDLRVRSGAHAVNF